MKYYITAVLILVLGVTMFYKAIQIRDSEPTDTWHNYESGTILAKDRSHDRAGNIKYYVSFVDVKTRNNVTKKVDHVTYTQNNVGDNVGFYTIDSNINMLFIPGVMFMFIAIVWLLILFFDIDMSGDDYGY